MKIAIVGGGFTGLSASYTLSELGHDVTLFEKEDHLGGLASGTKLSGWQWHVEQHYHHWFTNDTSAITLIKKLGLFHKFIVPTTLTSLYYDGIIYPFNGPSQILRFSPISVIDRMRLGFVTMYLKLLSMGEGLKLEKFTASDWLKKYYGEKVFEIVWKPLLVGKFGRFAEKVNMAWFWARIKKRTLKLGYIEGGYQTVVDAIAAGITQQGGKIHTNTAFDPKLTKSYDKVIFTIPSPLFINLYPLFPSAYKQRLLSIPHLHALNLVLISKEKFLSDVYWLNVNDRKFPFIALVQQTNLVDPNHYGGSHILYIANYLSPDHPYLKLPKEKLFSLFKPFLHKINPSFDLQLTTYNLQLFFGPFAQPVFPLNYSQIKTDFATPIPNVYLANMDMVYPWDRGTNYAIEMGQQVAKHILDKR